MTTNPKLFQQSVRDFITDEFSNCSLYLLVKQPCHELQKGQRGFKLDSTELFYLVFYVLDYLKTTPDEEGRQLFILDLQQELEEWIYKQCGEEQLGSNIAMVLCAASILLSMSNLPHYTTNCIRLKQLIIDDYAELCTKLDCLFAQRLAQMPHADRVQQELEAYLQSDHCFTDVIDDFRKTTKATEEDDAPLIAEECPFKIADKKLHCLYIVLRTIYLAGWLVGLDGKEMKRSQGKAMKFILRHGFGIRNTKTFYQNIQSSDYKDEKDQLKAIEELHTALTQYLENEKRKKGKINE